MPVLGSHRADGKPARLEAERHTHAAGVPAAAAAGIGGTRGLRELTRALRTGLVRPRERRASRSYDAALASYRALETAKPERPRRSVATGRVGIRAGHRSGERLMAALPFGGRPDSANFDRAPDVVAGWRCAAVDRAGQRDCPCHGQQRSAALQLQHGARRRQSGVPDAGEHGRPVARWDQPLDDLAGVDAAHTTLLLAEPAYTALEKDRLSAAVKQLSEAWRTCA